MSYPIEVGKVSILESGDGTYDVGCTRCLSFVPRGEYLSEPEAWQRALACAAGFRHDCSDVKEDAAAEVAWRAQAEVRDLATHHSRGLGLAYEPVHSGGEAKP